MKKFIKTITPAYIWGLLSILKNNPSYIKRVLLAIKNYGIHKALDKIQIKLNQDNLADFYNNVANTKTEDRYITNEIVDAYNSLSIAVTVHVYYLDKVDQIIKYIKNIPYKYTVYFTVCKESEGKLNLILKQYGLKDYRIIIVENFGYDILPFLKILPLLTEQKHDLVCKIHTKKGAANLEKYIEGIDNLWFKILMDSVLCSKDLVKKIIFAFDSDKELGMTGSADVYKSAQKHMYGNEKYTTEILNKISYNFDPLKDWGFFAGSMFWARLKIFEPLIKNKALDNLLNKSEIETMNTGSSASVFHGMERIFGLLASIQSMKTGLVYFLDINNKSSAVQILNNGGFYSPINVGMSLKNEYEVEKNYNLLIDTPLFDKNFYIQHSTTCKKLSMDPLLHFLRYGVYQNDNPNKDISPFAFWNTYPRDYKNRINPLISMADKNRLKGNVENMPENINVIMDYIKKSGLFDKKYYLNNYLDVARNGIDPLLHYCETGYKEGRIPSPEFDCYHYELEYLNQYIEHVNPMLHYILIGKKKGFKPKPLYTHRKTQLVNNSSGKT